jgi:hypothetical protein
LLRKIALALGLIFSFIGMNLTLIILKGVSDFFAGRWVTNSLLPSDWGISEILGYFTIPAGVFVTLGFIFLALGILYPEEWEWPEPEGKDQATSENEE